LGDEVLGGEKFSFDTILQIDVESLEDYIADGDKVFEDQLDANAGAGRTINKNEIADEPALQAAMTDYETNPSTLRKDRKGGVKRS
jgi:hypothetical protein